MIVLHIKSQVVQSVPVRLIDPEDEIITALELVGNLYQLVRLNVPGDSNLQKYHRKNSISVSGLELSYIEQNGRRKNTTLLSFLGALW